MTDRRPGRSTSTGGEPNQGSNRSRLSPTRSNRPPSQPSDSPQSEPDRPSVTPNKSGATAARPTLQGEISQAQSAPQRSRNTPAQLLRSNDTEQLINQLKTRYTISTRDLFQVRVNINQLRDDGREFTSIEELSDHLRLTKATESNSIVQRGDASSRPGPAPPPNLNRVTPPNPGAESQRTPTSPLQPPWQTLHNNTPTTAKSAPSSVRQAPRFPLRTAQKQVELLGKESAISATTSSGKNLDQRKGDITKKLEELGEGGVSHLNTFLEKIKNESTTLSDMNKLLDEAEIAIEAAELELDIANKSAIKFQTGMKLHLVGQDQQVGLGDCGKQLRDDNREGFTLIGTSCLGNLELIKQIKGKKDKTPHLIIADLSADVSDAWDKIRDAIISSFSWQEMVKNIIEKLKGINAEDSHLVEEFLEKLGNLKDTSFNSQDALYIFLRAVALRAIMMPCDYSQPNALKNTLKPIAWACKKGGDFYSSNMIVYASNIYKFIKEDDRGKMIESVALLRPKAIVATDLYTASQAPSKSQATNKIYGAPDEVKKALDPDDWSRKE